MTQVFDILNDSPTLTYPNGGETISNGTITIQWREPDGMQENETLLYEIFLSTDYAYEKPNLIQIATVLSGNSSFVYRIPKNISGKKCRVGIRAVNYKGTRGRLSYSASDFIISGKRVPTPAVFSPVRNEVYFSHLPFVFDSSSLIGRCSQRSVYQIYYKSDKQGIGWSLLKGNILVDTDPFEIDISEFSISDDYIIKVELVDGDNVSDPVFIDPITINHINYFLIDTVPPQGSIKVINNSEYTKNRNVVLKVESYDETSAVKEFRIEQSDVGSLEQPSPGKYVDISDVATWNIVGNDGVKLIRARLKDYAGNTVEDDIEGTLFRTYKSLNNREITAFLHNGTDIYIAFSEYGGDPSSLYKNQNLLSTLDSDATSLCFFNDVLYVGIEDDDNKGVLQRYLSTGSVETVRDNSDQYVGSNDDILNSLYDADSVITTMVVYDNKLFMGLYNGKILSFDGSAIEEENDTYENVKIVKRLFTDGKILYIFLENSDFIVTMYKNSSEEYVFDTISMSE